MRTPAPAKQPAVDRSPPRGSAEVHTAVWLAGFILLCFVYFLPRWLDWNQDARMDMTMAIVNHGTIAINAYHANTGDDDKFETHYYSNKAPGQSLVGVPVYLVFNAAAAIPPIRAAVNAFERNSAWNIALQDADCFTPVAHNPCRFVLSRRLDFALIQYLESVITVAIPSVLTLLLFFWFLGFLSSSLVNRVLLTATLGLGTIVFPFSQQFYSHVPAMAFDFAGFVLVYVAGTDEQSERRGTRWFLRHKPATIFLAGLSLGLSAVFEYPAALIVMMIGLYALYRLPKYLVIPLIAGVIPPLAVVMSYNVAAYHDPLTTGYGCYETVFKNGECRGIAGFTWPPSGRAVKEMSVGRYRGVFFLSPFLLLAIPGYFLWCMRSARDRATPLLCLALPIVFFFTLCMYWGWNAGTTVGPRYLMELFPFLTLPVIVVMDGFRSLAARLAMYALGAVSIFNIWVETLGGHSFARGPIDNPLFEYSLPQLARGNLPMNLGNFIGLTGGLSIIPLAVLLAVWSAFMFFSIIRQTQSAYRPNELLVGGI